MAEEPTAHGERMNRHNVPEGIANLEDEIVRARQNASSTIREIKSRAADFARSEIRDRIATASDKTSYAVSKATKTAWSRTNRWRGNLKARMARIDKKTVFYVAGGVLTAGSLAMFLLARNGKKRNVLPTTGERRALFQSSAHSADGRKGGDFQCVTIVDAESQRTTTEKATWESIPMERR